MKKQAVIFALSFAAGLSSAAPNLLPLKTIQRATQITLNEQGELFWINQQKQLWQQTQGNEPRLLAEEVAPHIAPSAKFGKIAAADNNGFFLLYTPEKIYRSNIKLAKNASMQMLAFATIAVVEEARGHYLARLETEGETVKIVARSRKKVLPDSRPLQINLQGQHNDNGHIAVLAEPDSKTYRHAVLGDGIEAKTLRYLERHTLEPLAADLTLARGLVFEANQPQIWANAGKNYLVSTISGNSEGARAAVIGVDNGELQILYQSHPLPHHRWQSPFAFNGELYSVQMPHLIGRLVQYIAKGEHLTENPLESGLSNHKYGAYETNLAAVTADFAVIPKAGYRQVVILDKSGNVQELPTKLNAAIIKTVAAKDRAYLLLENGEVWVVEDKAEK